MILAVQTSAWLVRAGRCNVHAARFLQMFGPLCLLPAQMMGVQHGTLLWCHFNGAGFWRCGPEHTSHSGTMLCDHLVPSQINGLRVSRHITMHNAPKLSLRPSLCIQGVRAPGESPKHSSIKLEVMLMPRMMLAHLYAHFRSLTAAHPLTVGTCLNVSQYTLCHPGKPISAQNIINTQWWVQSDFGGITVSLHAPLLCYVVFIQPFQFGLFSAVAVHAY